MTIEGRSRRRGLLARGVVGAALLIHSVGVSAQTKPPIKVGAISSSQFFPEALAAVRAYFDTVNAAGGIQGRPLQLVTQDENWFSRIQRDVIRRGIFTSVKDLDKKLMRYIRRHNKDPKPVKWKYDDPSRRHRQFI